VPILQCDKLPIEYTNRSTANVTTAASARNKSPNVTTPTSMQNVKVSQVPATQMRDLRMPSHKTLT